MLEEIYEVSDVKVNGNKMKTENKNRDMNGRFVKGHKHTKQAMEKIIKANIGNKNHFGKKHSAETKRKLSMLRKGKKVSEETKSKISNGNKGNKHSEETKTKLSKNYWKNPKKFFFGKKHSAETKRKLSMLRKGKTFEQLYGIDKAKKIKKKIGISTKKQRETQILPKKDTTIEVKVQTFLKQLGIEFVTHQYMKEIEHGYQCDILIPLMNLVIECDGDYWHKYPIGTDIDHIRTSELIESGFKVLRLWENEIKIMKLDKFKNIIKDYEEYLIC